MPESVGVLSSVLLPLARLAALVLLQHHLQGEQVDLEGRLHSLELQLGRRPATAAPQSSAASREQAERLAQFIRALPERPALVVGHSMGGQIVGLLAARHPETAPRIVLMSSAGVRFEENAFANAVLAGQNPFQVTNRRELKRYLGIVFAEPPFVPWPASEALVRRRRADAPFEQRVLDGIGRGPDAFALEAELANIQAHTLLLWCRDDRVIDVSAAEVFHRGLARSRTVILAGCGHMPMMAQPRLVADAIAGFMDGPG